MYFHFLLFLVCFMPVFANCTQSVALVSMAPYVNMVEELTGGKVKVELLVPVGYSAHTYEPTPKQILNAAKASIWFTVEESFEARAKAALQSENSKLRIVDLRQGLSLMDGHEHEHEGHHHCCGTGADTHIWMSPKMMLVQIDLMAKNLKEIFPELSSTVEQNLNSLKERLTALDRQIHGILDAHKGEIIFVSHPAYGYFCREYGLTQESIEFEGKDPTPKHLYKLIEKAKADKVHTIFIQKQYSTKAAELVAQEIGAKLVMLDPYSEQYFESMLKTAYAFAEAG